jgi:hypothetical protein
VPITYVRFTPTLCANCVPEFRECSDSQRWNLTCGRSAGLSLVRTWNLIIRVGRAPVVSRISGSGIRRAVLRRIQIMNDKGRYRQFDCGRGKRRPLNVSSVSISWETLDNEGMSTQEFRIAEVPDVSVLYHSVFSFSKCRWGGANLFDSGTSGQAVPRNTSHKPVSG